MGTWPLRPDAECASVEQLSRDCLEAVAYRRAKNDRLAAVGLTTLAFA